MTSGRIRYLDGWRGLAIVAVVIGHFGHIPGINFGRFGVELFFVLSGRLMAEILFENKVALGTFFPRRFSRVYPALFFAATVLLLCDLAYQPIGITPWQYASAVTLTYNYAIPYVGRSGALDHIWSLCIEEHVYILLGVVALITRRYPAIKAPPILAFMIGFSVVLGAVQKLSGLDYAAVYWRSDVRGASILLGALSYLVLHKRFAIGALNAAVPVALVLCGVAANFTVVPDPIKYSVGTAFLAAGLTLIGHSSKHVIAFLENRALLFCGTISYSLYLWQQPFYKVTHGGFDAAIFLPCAVLVAYLSYRLVETPTRRILNAACTPPNSADRIAE